MARYSVDPRLRELEKALWRWRAQVAQAKAPLQKRLAEAALKRTQDEYRRIPQGRAFETEKQ